MFSKAKQSCFLIQIPMTKNVITNNTYFSSLLIIYSICPKYINDNLSCPFHQVIYFKKYIYKYILTQLYITSSEYENNYRKICYKYITITFQFISFLVEPYLA